MEKREKILIADKSEFMCIMLTTVLERLGFEVIGATGSGREAVEKYMELKPDIVLVDAALDDMDGIITTRMIADNDPSAVVIIMIKDSTEMSDVIVEAVRAGAKGFMNKPLSDEEVETSIGSALKRK